jgi:hypothetical protein
VLLMSGHAKNVEGRVYPEFHPGWGGCAEELFHYTSRYYAYAEAFLRNLTGDRNFSMAQFRATDLSEAQKELMALILSCEPGEKSGQAIVQIVNAVRLQKHFVNPDHVEYYRQYAQPPQGEASGPKIASHNRGFRADLSPLDPFLNLAERLRLPVAVREHHVETSLQQLAAHLDSPDSRIRTNLQNAIIQLHMAGYPIRNHPGLTHADAREIGDEDAV